MTTKKIKIIFMGTPQFAVPFLQALIDDNDFEVSALITQPDKPSGRKQIVTPPPVKVLANENNIEVLQPEKLKDNKEIEDRLKEINPMLTVVVAYGQIIPQNILNIAKLGNINVHPSLLPKYRGASPIQNAILNNDNKTGISIMLMDEKMDHGPILAQKEITLDKTETNQSLHDFFAGDFGIDLLLATIKQFITGGIEEKEQDHTLATFCKPIKKEEARIDWNDTVKNISAKVRGFYPWPIAWTALDNKRVKIFPPVEIKKIKKEENKKLTPGELITDDNKLMITCKDGFISPSEIQIEGKAKMSAKDFIQGHKDITGKKFE